MTKHSNGINVLKDVNDEKEMYKEELNLIMCLKNIWDDIWKP